MLLVLAWDHLEYDALSISIVPSVEVTVVCIVANYELLADVIQTYRLFNHFEVCERCHRDPLFLDVVLLGVGYVLLIVKGIKALIFVFKTEQACLIHIINILLLLNVFMYIQFV